MSADAFVIHPYLKSAPKGRRSPRSRLAETAALTRAIDLTPVHTEVLPLAALQAGTYIGSGSVARLAELAAGLKPEVIVFDCALSPLQQRNLEKMTNAKVIDKTALILEIFGRRARTKEGRLQVRLAHLTYQRSRLVRSWTHLERQRGGAGFLGGPGETQIELDRRLIDEEIVRIKKELTHVTQTRLLHRKARRRVPFPVVALVGYTNAGKSTLFNALTASGVLAKDMLFATLDPTMRRLKLPGGQDVILSDTVGFISDLPTELVMAFRATLEEVLEADLVVHVRDASHPDSAAQKKDVEDVLSSLGLSDQVEQGLSEVLNKTDLLEPDDEKALFAASTRRALQWPVSARTGKGIAPLLTHIADRLCARHAVSRVRLPVTNGAALAEVYRRARVLARDDGEDFVTLQISYAPEHTDFFAPWLEKETEHDGN